MARIHRRTIQKVHHYPDNHDQCDHSPGVRHPGMQIKWAFESITMNKPGGGDGIPVELFQILKWCCESATLIMPANVENSAVATGLEKVSFHSNAKKRQCQRMLKLSNNCTHFTC